MKARSYDQANVSAILHGLPRHRRTAFAAACCERVLPNYEAFSIIERWGDPHELRRALDVLWSFAASATIHHDELIRRMRSVEELMPDVDEFETVFGTLGLYAAAALLSTLESCLHDTADGALRASEYSIESIRQFVFVAIAPDVSASLHDDERELYIWSAPIMVTEIRKQRADLQFLQQHAYLTPQVLQRFKSSNSALGIRPIQRGLVKMATGLNG